MLGSLWAVKREIPCASERHWQNRLFARQGILSALLARIPVSWIMSRIPGVLLFRVGFTVPLAPGCAMVITVIDPGG